MISIYKLKPAFQSLLRPTVQKLFDAKITANQVTVAACIGSLVIAACMIWLLPNPTILWLMPIWMFIRMALNAIDGMLAREFNQQSQLGAYLNELCDVIADSALFSVFMFITGIHVYLIATIIFLAILSEYAGVMAPLIGGNRCYDGPMGKSDRAFVFGTLSVVIALNLVGIFWINLVLYIVVALLIYTIFNRVRNGIQSTNEHSN